MARFSRLEADADALIEEKKAELLAAVGSSKKALPRKARIFLWNTYWNQLPTDKDPFAYTGEVLSAAHVGGWCLKMEGRVMDIDRGGTRFTDMFHRVVIRLDPALYPDTPLVEWSRDTASPAADGLEFVCEGETPSTVVIEFHPDYRPPRCALPAALRSLLGVDAVPRASVCDALLAKAGERGLLRVSEGRVDLDDELREALAPGLRVLAAERDGEWTHVPQREGAAAQRAGHGCEGDDRSAADPTGTDDASGGVSAAAAAAAAASAAAAAAATAAASAARPAVNGEGARHAAWGAGVANLGSVSLAELGEALDAMLAPLPPYCVEYELCLGGDVGAAARHVDLPVESVDGPPPSLAGLVGELPPAPALATLRALSAAEDQARRTDAKAAEAVAELTARRQRQNRLLLFAHAPHLFVERLLDAALASDRASAGRRPVRDPTEAEFLGESVREAERAHALGMPPAHGAPGVEFEMFDMPLEVGPEGAASGEGDTVLGHGQSSTLFGPRPLRHGPDGTVEARTPAGTVDWREQAMDRYLGASA